MIVVQPTDHQEPTLSVKIGRLSTSHRSQSAGQMWFQRQDSPPLNCPQLISPIGVNGPKGWFKGKSTERHGTSGPEFYGCPSSNSWKCGTWKSWKLSNLWIAESVTKSAQKRWLVHVDGLRGPSWATNRPTNYIWAIPKMMHWKVFILYTWSVGPEFLMRATHFRERLGG